MNENLIGVITACLICIVLLFLGCFVVLIGIAFDYKTQIDKLKERNQNLKDKLDYEKNKADYFSIFYNLSSKNGKCK